MNQKKSQFTKPHLIIISLIFAWDASGLEKLPEGENGIAAKYPGDQGIRNDPAVFLADDFESHRKTSDLKTVWDSFYNKTRLAQEKENAFLGNQSIEFSVPEDRGMASAAAVFLRKKYDIAFLRYYSKFDPGYDIMGSAHNGGGISANMYQPNGETGTGVRANGKNHFYVTLDHGRQKSFGGVANPGYLGIYIYHPGQRHQWGDGFFPTGMVIPNSSVKFDFGPDFASRPNQVTPLGTWHCHELMVKANTPGEKDGRVATWVNGKLAMDFPNLRLRDVESLKIDHIQISLFIQKMKHPATRKWYDNVVAATSYIGPVSK